MRIVVSGTHASGKSTLISDFVARRRGFGVWGDLYDEIDGDALAVGPELFLRQFAAAEERLLGLRAGDDAISERSPVDMLAYLVALEELGRSAFASGRLEALAARAAAAMAHVDLQVLVRLESAAAIWVDEDEDPALREAMDVALADLADDPDIMGQTPVLEVAGTPATRFAQLEAAVARLHR